MSILKSSLMSAAILFAMPTFAQAAKPATVAQGVKEQTSGLYAQQLARKGFVTLAYDASHYGESGASHFDLYDKSQYVTPAVDKMAEFFGKHL